MEAMTGETDERRRITGRDNGKQLTKLQESGFPPELAAARIQDASARCSRVHAFVSPNTELQSGDGFVPDAHAEFALVLSPTS